MLDKIRESFKALKEIFELLIDLTDIIKRYPVFFISLIGLCLLYGGLYWYANDYPGTIARDYFEALGNRNHAYAWELLSIQYKDRRWPSIDSYREAYTPSAPHEMLKVNPKETSYWIFPTLFAESLRFEAEYELTERFTREDIEKPEQHINSLWLQIHHRRDYSQLIDGTLDNAGGSNPSLALRRYYKTTVVLRRKPEGETSRSSIWTIPSKWQIHYMNFTVQGLKPLQGFQ